MDFLALKDISETGMRLINPTSAEKILEAGRVAGLTPGDRVLDMGTGFGETLALWGEAYGVSGVGVDVRPYACERARARLAAAGLAERMAIVCGDAAAYAITPAAYRVAACLGATFVWGGFQPTLTHLRAALAPGGSLVIGEPYWRHSYVPPYYGRREQIFTEYELWQQARAAGFDIAAVWHASQAEWDRYESDNWRGLLRWLADNPAHPDRPAVLAHLHDSQAEYFQFAREYFGWALLVLFPSA